MRYAACRGNDLPCDDRKNPGNQASTVEDKAGCRRSHAWREQLNQIGRHPTKCKAEGKGAVDEGNRREQPEAFAQLISRVFVDRRCSSCLLAGQDRTPELPRLCQS